MADSRKLIPVGPFAKGMDSLDSPLYTPDGSVLASYNTLNRGGIYSTRPGHAILYDTNQYYEPRGMTMFQPTTGNPIMVKVIGNKILVSKYPTYTNWTDISLSIDNSDSPVFFAECVAQLQTQLDGSVKITDPKKVLIIQTGTTRAIMYDGTTIRFLETTECPIGTIMIWIGSRLWVASGKILHASNLLEPTSRSEENLIAGGGFFTLPDEITGMGADANLRTLLVFTRRTTTSISASILDRTTWGATPNFQSVLFPNIGCIAPKTVINQYGMMWWMAEGGVINLNEAINAYRSSKIHYKDEAMARSKGNIGDATRACSGSFNNLLFFSVPSGDAYNFHTWMMDEATMEAGDNTSPPQWTSIWTGTRPVEWVTTNIDGRPRCFHLSRDRVAKSSAASANVFESFIGDRTDYSVGINGGANTIPIKASIETKYLSNGAFATFDYVEFFLSEIENQVDLTGFYSSRHSSNKQVLTTHVIASTAPYNQLATFSNTSIPAYVRQTRRIRTSGDESQSTDVDGGVEDIYNRNKDKGFFVTLRWTGALALDYLILCVIQRDDQVNGRDEIPETTARYVDANGGSAILSTVFVTPTYKNRLSSPVSLVSPRISEEVYALI